MEKGLGPASFASKTDMGRVRTHNEDAVCVLAAPEHGYLLALLADGMGGHNAGEIASSMTVSILREALEPVLPPLLQAMPEKLPEGGAAEVLELLRDAVSLANFNVFQAAQADQGCWGMGTTLMMALLFRDRVLLAHVGDSRAYSFRGGRLVQLTRDHSMLQEQIDAGLLSPSLAQFAQHKNVITRAIGVELRVDADMDELVTQAGDIYLLCSDGLSDMLEADRIAAILAANADDAQAACDALVDAANAMGGRDNVSVVLLKTGSGSPQKEGWFASFRSWFG